MKRRPAMLALALGLCVFATGVQAEFAQVRAPQVPQVPELPDMEMSDVKVPAAALAFVAFGSFSGLKPPHSASAAAAARSPAVAFGNSPDDKSAAGLEDARGARHWQMRRRLSHQKQIAGLPASGESRFWTPDAALAFRHFEAAWQAGQEGRFDAAIASARQGVPYAPHRLAPRLQLLGLLLASGQWSQADHSASEAMRALGARPAVLVLRAYALQRGGQRPAASIYLDAALADTALSTGERLQFGLIAADAALAAGEPQKALQLLAPLAPAPSTVPGTAPHTSPDAVPHAVPHTAPHAAPDSVPDVAPDVAPDVTPGAAPDAGVLQRRQMALQALRRQVSIRQGQGQGAETPAWATPRVVCESKASAPFCEVWPAQTALYPR